MSFSGWVHWQSKGASKHRSEGSRSHMLSEEKNETSFPYRAEQRCFVTVGALKTIMPGITIAPFIFLDILIIIQDWGHHLFSSDLIRIWDSFPFLHGILELWLHRQSCCQIQSPWPCMLWWAACWSHLCTREEAGQDRAAVTPMWGPGPVPWRPSGSRECQDQMGSLPWAWGGCSTCMLCQGSFGAPRLPYKSWREGVPQWLKTKTPNILETASREIGRLPLFCCIFFFDCLSLS